MVRFHLSWPSLIAGDFRAPPSVSTHPSTVTEGPAAAPVHGRGPTGVECWSAVRGPVPRTPSAVRADCSPHTECAGRGVHSAGHGQRELQAGGTAPRWVRGVCADRGEQLCLKTWVWVRGGPDRGLRPPGLPPPPTAPHDTTSRAHCRGPPPGHRQPSLSGTRAPRLPCFPNSKARSSQGGRPSADSCRGRQEFWETRDRLEPPPSPSFTVVGVCLVPLLRGDILFPGVPHESERPATTATTAWPPPDKAQTRCWAWSRKTMLCRPGDSRF